jgi:transposase
MPKKGRTFSGRQGIDSQGGHVLPSARSVSSVMKDVSLGQRVRIVELRSRGKTPIEILRECGISTSQTKKWWGRHQRGVGLDDLPRSGRPHKLTKQGENKIRALLKRKTRGSTRLVAADYRRATGQRVGKSTISRVALSLGIRYRIRPKKPRLKQVNKEARVAFATQPRAANFWRKVISTDEKTFTLQFDSRGQWCEYHDEPEPRGTVKYDVGVRVWGGVGHYGLAPLFRIPKKMTGADYQKFLQTKVYPSLRRKFGDDFIFQQDGDGSHTAAAVRAWLDEQPQGWITDWPSHSPDLSPIENLWAILLRRLEGRKVRTEDGLWRALQEEWGKIPKTIWRKLGGSLPKRMELVVSAQGAPIKY